MILRNPHNQDVSIVYRGEQYSIEADGVVEVREDVGRFWLKLHSFLVEEESAPRVEKKPVVETENEPKVEEPVAPVEEAPVEEATPVVPQKPVVKKGKAKK